MKTIKESVLYYEFSKDQIDNYFELKINGAENCETLKDYLVYLITSNNTERIREEVSIEPYSPEELKIYIKNNCDIKELGDKYVFKVDKF